MELTDPGVDTAVLTEFRTRLLAGGAERRIVDPLLTRLQDLDLRKVRGKHRTDSTPVLAPIHTLNRLELVGAPRRAAVHALAVVAPDWLRAGVPPDWVDRYSDRGAE